MNRREFLVGAGTLAVAARPLFAAAQAAPRAGIFPPSVRLHFPSVATEAYLNSAAMHPIGIFASEAMKNVIDYRLFGPAEGRADFGAAKQEELKKKFGAMINASAGEIAYTANTSDGENIVVMGLMSGEWGVGSGEKGSPLGGKNIVIDELHFTTSLYMYKELEKKGVQLRIVKHKNWAIDPEDMRRRSTRTPSWCRWRWSRTSTASCTT